MELVVGKCVNCNKFYRVYKNYCTQCWEIIEDMTNPLLQKFDSNIYDKTEDKKFKEKYFNKYLKQFWQEFCKITKMDHTIISSHIIAKAMIDNSIRYGFSENKSSLVYLGLNGHLEHKTVMFPSNIIDDYITTYILPYDVMHQYEKDKLVIILGQSIINPWYSKNPNIKKYLGNQGVIPNTSKEIYELWMKNKEHVQKYFGNETVYQCNCGFKKLLKNYDIRLSIKKNISHNHNDDDIDSIQEDLEKMKMQEKKDSDGDIELG